MAWSPDGRNLAVGGGVPGSPELDDVHIWAVTDPAEGRQPLQ